MARDDDVMPPYDTVRSTLEHRAAVRGDAPYLIAARDHRALTYSDLLDRVAKCRNVLRSVGVPQGARIGIVIADPLEFAVALLTILCDGSWTAPLDPTLDVSNRELFTSRTSNLHLDAVLSDRAVPDSDVPFVVLSDAFEVPYAQQSNEPPHSGGVILSSSGTTGTPKVIALSEDQLVYTATNIARHNQLSTDDRGFNPLPLWHVNAEVVGLLATLVAGATLVLDDRFHRTNFWQTVDHFQVTWINAVPAIVARIAVVNEGESVPSRLRFVRSASAPLAPALLNTFQTNTGVAIVESYGMTEAASQICVNPLDGPRKIGSVGRPVGVELRITPVQDGDGPKDSALYVGQVEIRGRSVITRYDAEGYEDRFDADGWLKTGDLGFLDDDGYLFLVGRSDDGINRGGEKILPREIEDVALGSPHVVAAAVVGVADDVFGQVPVLYVQFAQVESRRDLEGFVRELETSLESGLARTRRPARLVVVESFPTHATGKILKKSLATTALSVLLERDLR
jgi:acyl-CoA synthetase (AMP-forming)/AMP-acid ligase II